eukprot:SM000070S21283  [mRNA]  locus=s70:33176:36042:+ [translate_table: standard]
MLPLLAAALTRPAVALRAVGPVREGVRHRLGLQQPRAPQEAFEEDGKLRGKTSYLFGATEPQLVHFRDGMSRVTHIPAIVAVTSPFPPSDKLGIKSVQMEEEMIVPMREMKMGWVPFVPANIAQAALRQLKEERVKKYEYCLPYLYQPLREEDFQFDSSVSIMYPLEGDNPPLVTEFDWKFDEMEEFTQQLIDEETLPASEKEKFMEFVREQVNAAKGKIREFWHAVASEHQLSVEGMQEKAKRQKALDDMSEQTKKSLQDMRFYKFYPVPSDNTPDISSLKAAYINRYYGKAHEVL